MKRLSIIKFIPALILLFILLFVCYYKHPLGSHSLYEGLTSGSASSSSVKIGVYDFLAPPTDANKVTDDTFNKFLDVYPSVVCSLPKTTCTNGTCTSQTPSDIDIQNCITDQKTAISDQKDDFLQQVTNDEMAYYNQNLSWPYDGYVQTYIDNHPDQKTFLGTWDTLKKAWYNRLVYTFYFKTNEAKESPPGPLSYQIFMGTAQPPAPKTVSLTP